MLVVASESRKQHKSANEQKDERCDESEWLDASFVYNVNSNGASGDAFDSRNEGIGFLFKICVFQYRVIADLGVKGFDLVNESEVVKVKETCMKIVDVNVLISTL